MRILTKWLLPVLTGLAVLGAALLPQQLSQLRDARQFGEVHTQTISPDSLSVREGPSLTDRMALYTGYDRSDQIILSFSWYEAPEEETEALAQTAQALLNESGVLPRWIFEEEPFDRVTATLLLLWDPAEGSTVQEPATYWRIYWEYSSNKSHQKFVQAVVDADSGLPIDLRVHDTNMSQWLPYKADSLRTLAERWFGLFELEFREEDMVGPMTLLYSVDGTELEYTVSRGATTLAIQLGPEERIEYDQTEASVGR